MSAPMEVIRFRKGGAGDVALVVDSWVESYRTAHAAGLIPNCIVPDHATSCTCTWNSVMRTFVQWVLQRPSVEVWVAFHPSEPEGSDLYGWLALERQVPVPVRYHDPTRPGKEKWHEKLEPSPLPLVHYVFVKQAYRELGIARRMMRAAGIFPGDHFLYTCKTGVVSKLGDSTYGTNARWMPLLARHPRKK